MANFDEDIKRITEEVLEDGTVDKIIRDNVVAGIKGAIENSFSYGKLRDAVRARAEEILVPYIENYDMSKYLVKLDTILTEMVNSTSFTDNKRLLENFRFMMEEQKEATVNVSDLFEEYKKFIERNMDTIGREVDFDGETVEYEAMNVSFEFEEEAERGWSSYEYATIEFSTDEEDQQDNLNRTIRLSRYKDSRRKGWEIRTDTNTDIYSLRYMDGFDLMIAKLQKALVRVVIDRETDDDYVVSDTKPEATFE